MECAHLPQCGIPVYEHSTICDWRRRGATAASISQGHAEGVMKRIVFRNYRSVRISITSLALIKISVLLYVFRSIDEHHASRILYTSHNRGDNSCGHVERA